MPLIPQQLSPVPVMRKGKLTYAAPQEVEYEMPSASSMFTDTINMIPMVSSIKGARALMGAKFITQSLPLKQSEAPLVDAEDEETGDFYGRKIGSKVGLVTSPFDGVVHKIKNDVIELKDKAGQTQEVPLRYFYAHNKKTFTTDTPLVKVGDQVMAGQSVAHSNFVTPDGDAAFGANLRVAYMPGHKGKTFEDAIMVSESAAKRLTSSHLYNFTVDNKLGVQSGKKKFIQLFPNKYTKDQLDKVDDNGIIKSGVDLEAGDPVFLSFSPRTLKAQDKAKGNLHKIIKNSFIDSSQTWEKPYTGRSIDAIVNRSGYSVNVAGDTPLQFGDKISSRYANKGVTAVIQPDDQMFKDKDGNTIDVLINPASVIGRVNPASIYEALLGKVAAKTGKRYKLPGFTEDSILDFVKKELSDSGTSDTEDLYDPITERMVPKVLTGQQYIMKLEHQAGDKWSAVDEAASDQNGQPGKPGGHDSSKRIGYLDVLALLSHGAKENLADIQQYRSGANQDMWRRIRMGLPLPAPEVPFIYDKFISTLKGAGINTDKKGSKIFIKALKRKDIDELTENREVQNSETIDPITKEPVKGGLMDMALHGIDGKRWSYIKLDEKVPNPIMEEPFRKILGITKQKMLDVLAGKDQLEGRTGAQALYDAYHLLDKGKLEQDLKSTVRNGRKTARDVALKRLNALSGLKQQGLEADDLFMDKVPVLPSAYRPVSAFGKLMLSADPNYLYKDLMTARDLHRNTVQELGKSEAGEEAVSMYNALAAVQGLGDPIHPKTAQKGVKGFIRSLSAGGPKAGMFLSKVVGHTVNTVGRGVVVPDSELDMDTIGVPENIAWKLYAPFVMRRMVKAGMPAQNAALNIERRTDFSKKFLLSEMNERPVLYNRAPSLHKFNVMASKPHLVTGDGIHISPLAIKPMNMDFDGDAINIHVPISDGAVKEANSKLMPSQNLFDIKQRRVHYTPSQEFTLGIWSASSPNKTKAPVKYKKVEEALQAYKNGEIDIDTPVEIG